MKRLDILAALSVLIIAGLWYCLGSFYGGHGKEDLYAVIYVDGEVYKSLPLDRDESLTVKGHGGMSCLVDITSGRADVTEADCPDKLCVRQKSIGSYGETIVCLPARIVIEIKGGEASENLYDAVSQ